MTPATPWARGRFDGLRRGNQLLFGRMFEDSGIEIEVFRPQSRVFCIGSAGCTALALAEAGHQVCAVDVNEAQAAYLRARRAGEGYRPGEAERLMARGRALIWPRARLREFMDLETTKTQTEYWSRHLNTKRFRWCVRVLLSAATLRLVYSAEMMAAIPARMDLELRSRLERGWARFPNRANSYARALFLSELPRPRNFDRMLLDVHHAEATTFLEAAPPGQFHAFSLSNILDATSETFGARLFQAVKHAAAPGAVAVLRSFRNLQFPGMNRASDDRSLLWGTVQVIPVEQP